MPDQAGCSTSTTATPGHLQTRSKNTWPALAVHWLSDPGPTSEDQVMFSGWGDMTEVGLIRFGRQVS
jgi:hypothetical protein